MILITLGTQKQSFVRLLELVEKSNITDEIDAAISGLEMD